jgi:hypothetical protein
MLDFLLSTKLTAVHKNVMNTVQKNLTSSVAEPELVEPQHFGGAGARIFTDSDRLIHIYCKMLLKPLDFKVATSMQITFSYT